jgi:hypothetical protein
MAPEVVEQKPYDSKGERVKRLRCSSTIDKV